MPDEFDQASELEQRQRDLAIIAASMQKLEAEYTGFCLNCGEPTSAGQRWCDVSCRNDHQERLKRA